MAVDRVLTSDEKSSLQSNVRFQNLTIQVAYDNSLMWTQDDGSSYLTEADRINWAKSRLRGQSVVISPTQVQGATLSPQFIIFLTDINLWDSAISAWAPGAFLIGDQRTYGGNVWERLTAGSDTFVTPPVQGANWTQIGVVNDTIIDYMISTATFTTLAADWMSEQTRGIDMGA